MLVIRRILIGLVLLLVAGPGLAQGAEPTVRIAAGDFPPWIAADLPGGGYVSTLLRAAFAASDYQIQLTFLPWKRALQDTERGLYDATAFWAADPARDRRFLASSPVVREKLVFFRASSQPCIIWSELQDLAGQHIGATLGYTYLPEFWALAEAQTLKVEVERSDLLNLLKLRKRRLDIALMGLSSGLYLNEITPLKSQEQSVTACPQPLATQMGHVLFPKTAKTAVRYAQALEAGLDKLSRSGELQALQKQYLPGNYQTNVGDWAF